MAAIVVVLDCGRGGGLSGCSAVMWGLVGCPLIVVHHQVMKQLCTVPVLVVRSKINKGMLLFLR